MSRRAVGLASVGLCAVILILAACTPASSGASPSGTPVAAFGQAAAIGCGNDVDLLAPDGREIDLTGLWTNREYSDVPLWNVRQVGDCFFMVFRHPPGDEDPEYFDELCDGHVQPDFQIPSRCVDFIHRTGPGVISGQADIKPQVFLISFDATNEVQLQRCPATLAPGTCEEPMIRFDLDTGPAETASPT